MSFPSDADALRWLELKRTNPVAYDALPERAKEMAVMAEDMQAAREHRPAERWSRRDDESDRLLTLRDGDDEARKQWAALPDHVRDRVLLYEDVVGRSGA